MSLSDRSLLALVLAGGVIVPGVLSYFVGKFVDPTLGSFVWYTGFATMVFLVWYLFIRPLDLTGPVGNR